MVGACSHRVPLIPCYSGASKITVPSYTGLSPSLATLSNVLIFGLGLHIVSRTPDQQADLVWSVPLSLATTYGIAFAFFSSAY